ncbi:MAG: SH3 domain-containing protein [Anaerolineae bacterium]|nr:SH3 domain-containing protein [Anaerolineae bacterium]
MSGRHWSLAVVLILINYLIFATLFSQLLETDFSLSYATRTPIPTFTPAPAQPFVIVPTLTPPTPVPTPTATLVLADPDAGPAGGSVPAEVSAASESPAQPGRGPNLVSPGAVNIRSGPGLNYTVMGTLNANTAMPIVGRNGDASWWQIEITNGAVGWVSDAVVSTSNTGDVPMVESPAPPPASTPVPAQPAASSPPPQPKYQFEPIGWWDDGNKGLTRFYGDITDLNGNPVDGVFVRATCGDYATISYPSGPVGWGAYNEGHDWPPGFYDITVDTKPVPCVWTLSVVDTDDRETVKAVLSEVVPVEVTMDKSIIVAGWKKNW